MVREFEWILRKGQAGEALTNTALWVFKYAFRVSIPVAWVRTALWPGRQHPVDNQETGASVKSILDERPDKPFASRRVRTQPLNVASSRGCRRLSTLLAQSQGSANDPIELPIPGGV